MRPSCDPESSLRRLPVDGPTAIRNHAHMHRPKANGRLVISWRLRVGRQLALGWVALCLAGFLRADDWAQAKVLSDEARAAYNQADWPKAERAARVAAFAWDDLAATLEDDTNRASARQNASACAKWADDARAQELQRSTWAEAETASSKAQSLGQQNQAAAAAQAAVEAALRWQLAAQQREGSNRSVPLTNALICRGWYCAYAGPAETGDLPAELDQALVRYERNVDLQQYQTAADALGEAARVRTRILARAEAGGTPTETAGSSDEILDLKREQAHLEWYERVGPDWDEALAVGKQCQQVLRERRYAQLLPLATAAAARWYTLVNRSSSLPAESEYALVSLARENAALCLRIATCARKALAGDQGTPRPAAAEDAFTLTWKEQGFHGNPFGNPPSRYQLHLRLGRAEAWLIYGEEYGFLAAVTNSSSIRVEPRRVAYESTNRVAIQTGSRRRIYQALDQAGIWDCSYLPWGVLSPARLKALAPDLVEFPGKVPQPGDLPRKRPLSFRAIRLEPTTQIMRPLGDYDSQDCSLTVRMDGWELTIKTADHDQDQVEEGLVAERLLKSVSREMDALIPLSVSSNYTVRKILHPTPTSSQGAEVPEAQADVQPAPAGKQATAEQPYENGLGMKLVPVPGTKVLFSIWETRVRDFAAFARDGGHNSGWSYRIGGEPHVMRSDGLMNRGWDYGWDRPGFEQTLDHPVTCVGWEDAVAFCRWLSETEHQAGRLGLEQEYRLPTDAEWSWAVGIGERETRGKPGEKAAGLGEVYPWGTQWPPPPGAGNYAGEEVRNTAWPADWLLLKGYRDRYPRTAPVGQFDRNRYGLFDLGGNVREWCQDWYDAKQQRRVSRGASWIEGGTPVFLTSANRHGDPGGRTVDCGFRVVLAPATAR